MATVKQIDFSRYRTPELAEEITELLSPEKLVGRLIKWLFLGTALMCVLAAAMFAWQTHWAFLVAALMFAMFDGFLCGFLFGFARVFSGGITQMQGVFNLLLDLVAQINNDCREVSEGKMEMPKRADLIRAVYLEVFTPVLEGVIARKFGIFSKPILWAYSVTLKRFVKVFIRRSADDFIEKEPEQVEQISTAAEGAVATVGGMSSTIDAHLVRGRNLAETIAGYVRGGLTVPFYAASGFFFWGGMAFLVILRQTVRFAMSGEVEPPTE